MSNTTSPHLFKDKNDFLEEDSEFIYNELKQNKFALFLRKVSPDYPDEILLEFIYNTKFDHKYIDIHSIHSHIKKKDIFLCDYIVEMVLLIGSLFSFFGIVFILYKSYLLSIELDD
jgi:hypothetical protein